MKEPKLRLDEACAPLLDQLSERAGVALSRCFQCAKCSGGCAVADATDLLPHVLVRLIQVGDDHAVLASRHIWLCIGCQACSSRCPNEVDLAGAIDELRQISLGSEVPPGEPDVAAFHRVVLETVRRHGRLFELGMIMRLKTETGQYVKDLGMGIDLVRRGKIRLVASNVRDPRELDSLFDPEPDDA